MRLSELARMSAETESGEDLGRLIDIEAAMSASAGCADHADVRGLVCGTLGVLERVGLRSPRETLVAWQRVVHLGRGRIVVSDAAAPAKHPKRSERR